MTELDPQKEYDGLSQREHVLKRPDTYVGSIEREQRTLMLAKLGTDGSFAMKETELQYIPGLERIYLEILSNAADNGSRSAALGIDPGKIVVYITDDSCSIYNEGRPVSTVWHDKQQDWIPSFIFFVLLTGSNYDDSKERKWAGRNGLGAKLAAIFSKYYQVDCHNLSDGIHHHQVATKNLSEIAEPIRLPVRDPSVNNLPNQIPDRYIPNRDVNYTKLMFKPDFKLFYTSPENADVHREGLLPLTDDPMHCPLCWDKNNGDQVCGRFDNNTVEMFAALALDFSFNCKVRIDFIYESASQGVPEKPLVKEICFDARSAMEYVKCYMPEVVHIKTLPIVYESPDGDTRLIMLDTPHNGSQRSFANGMPTRQGGVHVNDWLNGICAELKAELKKKGCEIDARNIKSHVTIFLSYYCNKPRFETQTKERLTGPHPKVAPTKAMFDIFSTWNAVTAIKAAAASREKTKIAKATDGKKERYVKVEGLDDADHAGTDRASECILFFCEGKSAKTFFADGLQHVPNGRDYLGCLPLRGKILNTQKATNDQYMKNKVCIAMKTALGLREELDYSLEKNRRTLRYGRCYALTDADVDGTHIKILIANFLSRFKGLLESGFFHARLTPVMIVNRNKEKRRFYSLSEYSKWCASTPDFAKWKTHYFKGLGSATKDMIKEAFTTPVDQHLQCTSEDQDVLELAMGAEHADTRKKLYRMLIGLRPDQRLDARKVQRVEDIVYEELILSAIDFNRRGIPSIVDGLKDSYRKVVYAALQTKNEWEGVGEFQGFVKTLTKYRHGPDAMEDTIVGLAQTFPGSNNINLLEGQEESFGSRIGMGKDHSAARYIHCKPSPVLKKIFRPEDDVILEPEMEEGKQVGVMYYFPILPLMLINRCKGMGWGWATESPNYNPMQLIEWIKAYCQYVKDGKPRSFTAPTLIPWWKGYKCVVFRKRDGQLITRGYFENRGITCYVRDVPLPWSAEKYELKVLEKLVEEGKIEGWKPTYVDKNRPSYILRGCRDEFKLWKELGLEKNIVESSMTFLDTKDIPQTHYHGVQHVMLEWSEHRYAAYVKRKEFYVKKLEESIRIAELRQKFILDVVEGRLDLRNQVEEFVTNYMIEHGYPTTFLSMALSSLTRERVARLIAEVESLQKEVEDYKSTHPADMWIRELIELSGHLEKLYPGEWEVHPDYGKKTMERPE